MNVLFINSQGFVDCSMSFFFLHPGQKHSDANTLGSEYNKKNYFQIRHNYEKLPSFCFLGHQ